MKTQTTKEIMCILLGIASPMFVFGLIKSGSVKAGQKHDPAKIGIEIISKDAYYDNRGTYYVEMNYQITNNTKVMLNKLKIKTLVYSNSGSLIGTITTELGGYGNELSLKAGKNTVKNTYLQSYNPDNDKLFYTLYVERLSDLTLEYEIYYAEFDDGYTIR